MKRQLNIDILGGLSVLAIVAFFFFQLDEDFTMFGLFFPERVMPILTILGVAIIVKGFVRPSRPKKPVFQINRTMLVSMLAGLGWVLLLVPLGFVLTSFVCVCGLLVLYTPREERTAKGVLINAVGSFVIVYGFYYAFVQFLGVTLPKGVLTFL